MLQQLSWSVSVVLQIRHRQAVALTSAVLEAGGVEFAHVKLHPNDGKHNNGEEEQQTNLKKWNHGFHYRLQHHLEAWETRGEEENDYRQGFAYFLEF